MNQTRILALVAVVVLCAAACGDRSATPTGPEPPTPTTAATSSSAPATSATATPVPGHAFPVQPATEAEYARAHHDYPAADIFAACGTPVVATTGGVVDEVNKVDTWEPDVDDGSTRSGLLISIVGDDGVRYYGSHLGSVEDGIAAGARVEVGDLIGTVGDTGNARGTACHLHFGISPPTQPGDWEVRRGVVWPWPYLDAWKAGESKSPTDETMIWADANLR